MNLSSKAFGNYIRNRRKELKITKQEFAERLSVSEDTLNKWETGTRYPDFEMVALIAEELNLTVQDIYDNSKETNKSEYKIIIFSVIALLIAGTMIGALVRGNIGKNNVQETVVGNNDSVQIGDYNMDKKESSGVNTLSTARSLFYNQNIYLVYEFGDIADAPSIENATFIGTVKEVTDYTWPKKELCAAYLEIGDRVYEMDNFIYVYGTEKYYKMYSCSELLPYINGEGL